MTATICVTISLVLGIVPPFNVIFFSLGMGIVNTSNKSWHVCYIQFCVHGTVNNSSMC